MFQRSVNFGLIATLTFVLFSASSCTKTSASATTVKTNEHDLLFDTQEPETNAILQVIRKAPDSPVGYIQLAAIYIRKARANGDFDLNTRAERCIDKALELDPSNMSARKLKASLQLTFHRFAEGRVLGEALVRDAPDDAFNYGILTDANDELGNYELAVESVQKMVNMKPSTSSYARVGHVRSLHGDHSGAIEMLTLAARSADPQDHEEQSWCLVQLGDEYWKYGDYAKADKVYEEALNILPNYHLALNSYGRVKASLNDNASAIQILTDVQNRVPNVDAIILLGDLYSIAGDDEKAKEQYDLAEVIEQKLGVAGDKKRLSLLWADHDRDIPAALEIAKSEYETRQDVFTADIYAWCLYKNDQTEEAKKYIEEALRLKTGDARILYHAGMISKQLGMSTEAKKYLTSALKLNPAFDLVQAPIARKALAEIK